MLIQGVPSYAPYGRLSYRSLRTYMAVKEAAPYPKGDVYVKCANILAVLAGDRVDLRLKVFDVARRVEREVKEATITPFITTADDEVIHYPRLP